MRVALHLSGLAARALLAVSELLAFFDESNNSSLVASRVGWTLRRPSLRVAWAERGDATLLRLCAPLSRVKRLVGS
jgi:hypothetical protein